MAPIPTKSDGSEGRRSEVGEQLSGDGFTAEHEFILNTVVG